jgi:D-tyrosyl-tRNA(Tyr) deacylase
MKAVLQRVSKAGIVINGEAGGTIGPGLVVLLGVMQGDTEVQADILAEKLVGLRIFTDENDKMNLSVTMLAEAFWSFLTLPWGQTVKRGGALPLMEAHP